MAGDPLTLAAGVVREPFWRIAAIVTLPKGGRYVALAGAMLRIAKRTCMKKAIVAVARKLATMLLAMWKSETAFWVTPMDPASANGPGHGFLRQR